MQNRFQRMGWMVAAVILTRGTLNAQIVSIPDPVLDRAIRDELAVSNRPIEVVDLEKLTFLDAGTRVRGCDVPPIRSLEGLQHAIHLKALVLTGWDCTGIVHAVEVTDYSPIAGLTNLTTLDLSWNLLEEIELSEGFGSLTNLNLSDNFLRDLTVPSGFDPIELTGPFGESTDESDAAQ